MRVTIDTIRQELERLSKRYPFFGGTIERTSEDDIPRLRWYSLIDPNINADSAIESNNAVAALDALAADLIPILSELGIEVPDGETAGAKVMNWLLQDRWNPYGYPRVSLFTPGNAFDAILHEIAHISKQADTDEWIAFREKDSINHRSTLGRHAEQFPNIIRKGDPGEWFVIKSHAAKYIKDRPAGK